MIIKAVDPILYEKTLKDLSGKSDIIFICVPTPMNENGSCCLDIVNQVLHDLNSLTNNQLVVIKSTVPPGTCKNFQNKYKNLDIIFNPEFLTEANFFQDFMNQDRIILGGKKLNLAEELYKKHFPKSKIIMLDYAEAEMVKYFSNSFLALKVSFANEIHSLCDKLNIDYNQVVKTAIKDVRIGSSHLSVPGPDGEYGFGGTCFPKDLTSLIVQMENLDVNADMLKEVWKYNQQIRKVIDWPVT